MSDEHAAVVERIFAAYGGEPPTIVQVLQDLQRELRHLPVSAVKLACDRLGVPLSRAFSVGTFYKAFSLKPRGRRLIRVCVGTACHIRGARDVVESLEESLRLRAGETSPDLAVTLETVNCVGACALGPVVVVDRKTHGMMSSDKARRLAEVAP